MTSASRGADDGTTLRASPAASDGEVSQAADIASMATCSSDFTKLFRICVVRDTENGGDVTRTPIVCHRPQRTAPTPRHQIDRQPVVWLDFEIAFMDAYSGPRRLARCPTQNGRSDRKSS